MCFILCTHSAGQLPEACLQVLLLLAVEKENLGLAALLCEKEGADANAGKVLRRAVQTGNVGLVELLMRVGKQLSFVDLAFQSLCLSMAIEQDNASMCELLLRRGPQFSSLTIPIMRHHLREAYSHQQMTDQNCSAVIELLRWCGAQTEEGEET